MDKTSKLFDVWAKTGRSEDMEKGHGTTVNQFLNKLSIKQNFRFLDIGCGNGWVVRKMSQHSFCIKAIGIDKSKMKKGGIFYCGTDFYSDNKLTTRWIKDMNIPMDLRSEKEWKKMFKEIGFSTRSKHVTDPKNKSKWKREFGTLFVIGRKP